MLEPLCIKVRTISEIEAEEKGDDFQSNAYLKAKAYFKATAQICLADDSGLAVDALGGRPGVHSARYGGPGLDDNGRNVLLLRELEGFPFEKRTARFICVLVLYIGGKPEEKYAFEGRCEGYIAEEASAKKGFGYDPIFFDPELRQTFGQIDAQEKNKRSHRAKAIQKLIAHISQE